MLARDLSHIWRPRVRQLAEELLTKYSYEIIRIIADSVIIAGAAKTEEFVERYRRRVEFSKSHGIEFDAETYYQEIKRQLEKVVKDPRFSNIDNPFMKEQAILLAESGLIPENILHDILRILLGNGRTDAQKRKYLQRIGLIG